MERATAFFAGCASVCACTFASFSKTVDGAGFLNWVSATCDEERSVVDDVALEALDLSCWAVTGALAAGLSEWLSFRFFSV